MKKLFVLSILTLFTISSNVFASALTSNQDVVDYGTYADYEAINEDISSRAETIIFDDLFNTANYSRTFTAYPSNGKNLNIFVVNSGNNPIEVEISIGLPLTTVTVQPGKSYTYTSNSISYQADWKLTVNDRTGAKMSGEARARQFD
jgi:hypothetical protein